MMASTGTGPFYGERFFSPGETLIYGSKPKLTSYVLRMLLHWSTYIPIIGWFAFWKVLFEIRATEHLITSRRVIDCEKKMFGRLSYTDISLRAIENVVIDQGFFQGLFNEGTIVIQSQSGGTMGLGRVHNPREFYNTLWAALNEIQG